MAPPIMLVSLAAFGRPQAVPSRRVHQHAPGKRARHAYSAGRFHRLGRHRRWLRLASVQRGTAHFLSQPAVVWRQRGQVSGALPRGWRPLRRLPRPIPAPSAVKPYFKGKGKGGRNSEFILSMAIALNSIKGIDALAIDTDGIDGIEDNAGAYISSKTLQKARFNNLDPIDYLSNNNSYSFFKIIKDLIYTSPTLTNVNDFRAVLIQP